jgi:hypothetical protein
VRVYEAGRRISRIIEHTADTIAYNTTNPITETSLTGTVASVRRSLGGALVGAIGAGSVVRAVRS